ncbi:unnamed protein product [Ilex paraguariensis]|uniref:Uncharacterized protein n=1 Tax=Ilex paraguariensis TaxID=185542 RepID=A0ABC8V204_9AQUA
MGHTTVEKGNHVVIDLNEAPKDSDIFEFGTFNGEYEHRQGNSKADELEKSLQDLSTEEVSHMKFNSEVEAGLKLNVNNQDFGECALGITDFLCTCLSYLTHISGFLRGLHYSLVHIFREANAGDAETLAGQEVKSRNSVDFPMGLRLPCDVTFILLFDQQSFPILRNRKRVVFDDKM